MSSPLHTIQLISENGSVAYPCTQLPYSERVLHTAHLLQLFPKGVLLCRKHGGLLTQVHFDQEGPCHILEFDEAQRYAGFHRSVDSKKGLYDVYCHGQFLFLGQGEFTERHQVSSFLLVE